MDIKAAHRLFEANVRIEGIWPLPNGEVPEAMLEAFEYGERLPDELQPFVRGWDEEEVSALFNGQGHSASDAWSELSSNLYNDGKFFVVALASNPVFEPSKGGGCHFSWGYYSTQVFVAETVEGLIDAAVAWGEANYAAARKAA